MYHKRGGAPTPRQWGDLEIRIRVYWEEIKRGAMGRLCGGPFRQSNLYAERADCALECKGHLKVNATVRGLRSTATARPAEDPTQRV